MFILSLNSGPKPWSDEFQIYVEQRGYDLCTFNEYEAILKDNDFVDIKIEDKTELFDFYLKKELEDFEKIKEQFIQVKLIFISSIYSVFQLYNNINL